MPSRTSTSRLHGSLHPHRLHESLHAHRRHGFLYPHRIHSGLRRPHQGRAPPGRGPQSGRVPLHADTQGVTEVVGQILAFAVVSVIFVLSMLAFQVAQEATADRVVELRAESAAARVAAVVVEAGRLAEDHGTTMRARLLVDLPADLEGRAYRVRLDVPGGGTAAQVFVEVPSRSIEATAPLFAIEAPVGVTVCTGTVPGGPLLARFGEPPSAPGTTCIFLEAAP